MFDATPIYETKYLTAKPENVRKLIAWLEEEQRPGLSMFSYTSGMVFEYHCDEVAIARLIEKGNWCGTHACIAGHAMILAKMEDSFVDWDSPHDTGMDFLGVDKETADKLFERWIDPYSIPEAIGKLEALLEPV